MRKLINNIRQELKSVYSESETDALIRIIALDLLKINNTTFFLRDAVSLTPAQTTLLDNCIKRLKKNEPIQYIIGEAPFCELTFKVNPSVLIPRPETSELIQWITTECSITKPCRILDAGTGSGCIAISLARKLPHAEVTAWDISREAIETAKSNNELNNTEVLFQERDILTFTPKDEKFDIIVSNPPYIKEKEKTTMESNVLDWEPALALFVPDNDPLLFYRTIAEKAKKMLTSRGKLFFEINREHGAEICDMLSSLGYSDVELRKDFAENDRMVKCSFI